VTCTVDSGLSISKEEKTVELRILDEDDNAPTSQTDEYFWDISESKDVRCVFLVYCSNE
jgi:hypothetical protein